MDPPATGEHVVKPTVSAGSKDTGRYDLADPTHRRLATDHVARLQRAGRAVMVQPYLAAVDTAGETALLHTPDADGRLGFSHAIRKGPLLDGPDLGVVGLYKQERIDPRAPSEAERAVAARVLAAVPAARTDCSTPVST
jgi:hypothetical protein